MSIDQKKDPADPVLEELHATRRRLLAEHGGVAGLASFLRQEEAKSERRIAVADKLEKKSPPTKVGPAS
jgi:hypothetical protein